MAAETTPRMPPPSSTSATRCGSRRAPGAEPLAARSAQDVDDRMRQVGRDGGVDVHGRRDDRASRATPARCDRERRRRAGRRARPSGSSACRTAAATARPPSSTAFAAVASTSRSQRLTLQPGAPSPLGAGHRRDHLARDRLPGLAADVAGQAEHGDRARRPRRTSRSSSRRGRRRTRRRASGSGRREVAHRPRPGLVDELRAPALAGLPHAERARPPGRPARPCGRPAGRRTARRRTAPPASTAARRGLVGAGHGDVGVPGRRRRRIARRLRADAGDVATAQARDEVAPGGSPGIVARAGELPPEQGGVEGHRRLGVGLQGVDPAGHSRLVVVALAHRRLPKSLVGKTNHRHGISNFKVDSPHGHDQAHVRRPLRGRARPRHRRRALGAARRPRAAARAPSASPTCAPACPTSAPTSSPSACASSSSRASCAARTLPPPARLAGLRAHRARARARARRPRARALGQRRPLPARARPRSASTPSSSR